MSDELAIRNVVARLAMLADEGDLEEYVDLFTDNARWDMPGGELQGRENLLAGAIERRAAGDGRTRQQYSPCDHYSGSGGGRRRGRI